MMMQCEGAAKSTLAFDFDYTHEFSFCSAGWVFVC